MSGVCTAWATADDMQACGYGADLGTDNAVLDDFALAASEVLYSASGRVWNGGGCTATVRPCGDQGQPCGLQVLDRGHIVGWNGRGWDLTDLRDTCCGLSRVKLSGYPVTAVTEVLIDGAAVDPSGYRLDEARYLTRLADAAGDAQLWPGCQRLDKADTEVGTFSVTYEYGAAPPQAGVLAAATLAGEWYRACGGTGDCALPAGVIRVVRQGVTIEAGLVAAKLKEGATGLTAIDMFLALASANPARRPAVWSPDVAGYARPVG